MKDRSLYSRRLVCSALSMGLVACTTHVKTEEAPITSNLITPPPRTRDINVNEYTAQNTGTVTPVRSREFVLGPGIQTTASVPKTAKPTKQPPALGAKIDTPPTVQTSPAKIVKSAHSDIEVRFAFDSVAITKLAAETLDSSINDLELADGIDITGHTDSIGSDLYNDMLSLRRAEAVRDHLASKGISTAKMHIKGVGERDPVAPNTSKDGRSRNRRVILVF